MKWLELCESIVADGGGECVVNEDFTHTVDLARLWRLD